MSASKRLSKTLSAAVGPNELSLRPKSSECSFGRDFATKGVLRCALLFVLFLSARSEALMLDECTDGYASLVPIEKRVSLVSALPNSKRYGAALLVRLNDESEVLVLGGGATIGHRDLIEVARKRFGSRLSGTRFWGN
jgi:hypothetical protein